MGPRKDNFTKDMDLKLIEFVRQHPELYRSQVELSTYHLKAETKAYLWKEFAPTVCETPEACEKRWLAIKFRYLRTTANPGLRYEYVDKLRFIDSDIIRKFTTIERISQYNQNNFDKSKKIKRKVSLDKLDNIATTSKKPNRTVQDVGRSSAPFRYVFGDDNSILDSSISEQNIFKKNQIKSEESDEEIVVSIKMEQDDGTNIDLEGAKIEENTCDTKDSGIYLGNNTEKNEEFFLKTEFLSLPEVKKEPEQYY